jgi:Derlin-2/3
MFVSALIMAFMYTWSQDNQGQQAHFYVISIPAVWLPYAMLAVTFVASSPGAAYVQATGIVAAHMYNFLTRIYPENGGGQKWIFTPRWVWRLFAPDGQEVRNRSYGTAFAPPQQAKSTGSSSGVLPESWKTRGTGHRLGGD